jgi:chaperonin GroES
LNTETGERIPLTVKKGDRVIFSSYSGTEIKLDNTEYLMMSEEDILAVID